MAQAKTSRRSRLPSDRWPACHLRRVRQLEGSWRRECTHRCCSRCRCCCCCCCCRYQCWCWCWYSRTTSPSRLVRSCRPSSCGTTMSRCWTGTDRSSSCGTTMSRCWTGTDRSSSWCKSCRCGWRTTGTFRPGSSGTGYRRRTSHSSTLSPTRSPRRCCGNRYCTDSWCCCRTRSTHYRGSQNALSNRGYRSDRPRLGNCLRRIMSLRHRHHTSPSHSSKST
jgi:hypothetical protein